MLSFQIKSLLQRLKPGFSRDLALFIGTVVTIGFAESIVNSIFNNFLSETFSLSSFYRTFLEVPRESGGLLVIFVSALLFFLPKRRMAASAVLIGSVGLVLLAFFSLTINRMFLWLFIFSLGQHLFMPLSTSIGMELAREGQTGKRLGQLNALRNVAVISGSFFVFLGFKYLHLDFTKSFVIAAVFYITGALLLYGMKPGQKNPPALHLKLHRRYSLYYWLSVLFGTRKQIFLTFAPWVLVTVYHQPTAIIATLFTISGVCGIVFQPLLGKMIDRLGERFVLTAEALLLVFVCAGYGFARSLFPEHIALIIACICFVADQLLMSVNMARSTYLKKIALHPDHITPTLSMSVSIDHVFSITVALLGGLLWVKLGYQAVFVAGAGIALVNLVSARFIRIPTGVNDKGPENRPLVINPPTSI